MTNNGTITGSTFTGPVTNSGEITGGTFTALVGASATEPGVISGGTFEGEVLTSPSCVISGGDFKNATVTSGGGIINGGTFSNFTMDSETGELTITGTVNLNANANALAPLTITLDDKSIQSITVEKDATFNAGSTPVSVDVTNDGTISGGMFTGKITGTGTITGGDFFGADISGFTGVLTGGTFAGFTISDTDYGRTLTITAQDFDLTEINLASFGLKRVVVAAGASVSDADLSDSTGITFQNNGVISGGTFGCYVDNTSTITGGTFNGILMNDSTITGATITGDLHNLSGTVTNCKIDGRIHNYSYTIKGCITGCTFGENAVVGQNEGTIEVTMTVNGADATFKYGENILSALETTFGEGEWYAVVDGTQTDILDTDTFGLQKQTYACAHYVGTDDEGKKVLYITTPTAVTDDMLAGISTIVVAAGGAITGGTFNGYVWNYATISGGTFNGSVGNMEDAVIHGADGSVPQINGKIYYNEREAQILQPCAFGANASVTAENNKGIIQVPMTVNGESRNFNFGDNVLDALNAIRSGADWCALEGDKHTPVKAEDAFGLQSRSYNYTYYVEDTAQGSILFITAPVEVTGEMLEGISTVDVTATGEITGGTFDCFVSNYATISGGTFNGGVWNRSNAGSVPVIQGKDGRIPEINGQFGSDAPNAQILQPCNFGPNASVTVANGTIEVVVIVNGEEKFVNYGADILETLGPSTTGPWYRVNAGGTRALVREGDTFASLQKEAYTSQILLPKPEQPVINYAEETLTVTLPEGALPEGVEVEDITVNIQCEGKTYLYYSRMTGMSMDIPLSTIAMYIGITLPSVDENATALSVYYSIDSADYTEIARSEVTDFTIPARPDINVDTVYPGYNEMTVTFDTEPYNVYLQSVKEPEKYFYDEDDGVVDGCIHGLTEGTEYTVHFRVPPTEDSFASIPYLLDETYTTLTRTRLSVEAAETSWSWRPGFSLTAEDCFTAQIATEGEVKELPEKGKFTLSAVNEDGEPVGFPLTNAGTYTVTASLAEDVANDYTLENGGVFTVTIDPLELPAPVLTLDYGAEIIAIAELPETLPEGIERESLWIDIFANDAGIAKLPPVLTVGSWFTLSDLGYWYGETLPAAAGKEDAVLSFCFSIEGYEGNIVGQAAELVIPARPEADAPDSDARANAVTWNSIQMLDADMLAVYDLGVAPRGDELPAEPTFVDEDGDGLITGLAEGTEYCLYFRKKATDSSFRSEWYARSDIWVSTYRRPALSAGVETAEYTWTPDFALDIGEEMVFTGVEDGTEPAVPADDYALSITDENGAQVTGTIRDAGTYTVKVTMESDSYVLAEGKDTFTVTVQPLDLSGEEVVLRVEGPLTVGYTGASVYPQIGGDVLEVELNGKYCGTLPADCFTIEAAEGKNDVNAGDAYLTIVGQGNATGRAELAYTITAKDIADESVNVEPIGELVYTGAALEPPVTVKDGEKALAEGTDYAVTYANNTAAGTATVTITGKGNYAGERTINFTIVQKDIAEDEGFTIDPIPDQVYTGGEIEPEITVKDGDTVLVEGEDYEVTFEENTDAGTVTVTITGTGNYAGETEVTFEIVKATAPAIEWPEVTGGLTYGQTVVEIPLSAMEDDHGAFVWKCPDCLPGVGEFLFPLVYMPDNADNYDYAGVPLECEVCVEVVPKDISTLTVDAIPAQTATGSALTPAVTVRHGDTVLAAGTDYTVTYANNTAVGTATVTITGMGNYTGTLTATFAIREAEKEEADEQDESTTEALAPARQAEALASGEAVDGTVTDRHGEAAGYVPTTEEVTDEETQEVLQRTLVIAAGPVKDENGEIVLRDGKPVYEQRNLNLSRGLLDALTDLGYTHIRFVVKDAALEWQIAEMTEESYVVRLAPMEANELSPAETEAIGDAETLTGSYRARITAMLKGEETDVTNAIPSLTAIFDAASIHELTEGEAPQLLLVPNDGEPEAQVSTVQYIEATDTEPARYAALLTESGLFVLALQ